MRFSDTFLDEIRARLPVTDVVGRKVTWDKRKSIPAKGDYWACCPFHGEKTPSFHADNRRQRYHCFGCKESGDIFTFVTKLEGLSFPEAVEQLASLAGLDMPERTPEDAQRAEERASLYDVMELAAKFFEDRLQASEGAAARGYLSDRGISARTIGSFRIGYAPGDRRALKTHLADNNITVEQMAEAGLVIAGQDIAVPYDRFRDRVIFPIKDVRGRVIAFGGRALSSDVPAKYLNSPDTPLFHKGRVLYNFDTARSAAYEAGSIICVEGYTDVIALVRAGFPQAVAPLGTALTEDQLKLMWKAVPEPVLCFDGDGAGLKAAYRAVDTALPLLAPGYSLKFALLEDGTDPDELISEGGSEAMQEVLDNSRPLSAMLWERELAVNDLSTPERRADFDARLHQAVKQIADERVRAHYVDHIRERLNAMAGKTKSGGGNYRRGGQRKSGRPAFGRGRERPWDVHMPASGELKRLAGAGLTRNAGERRERLILLAAINHPFLIEHYTDKFAALEFSNRDLDTLRKKILDTAALQIGLDTALLRDHLAQRGYSNLLGQLDAKVTQESDWFALPDAAKADVETGWAQLVVLHNKALTLQKELKTAEFAFAEDNSEVNFAHLNEIRDQIRSQAGEEAMVDGYGEASGRTRSAS